MAPVAQQERKVSTTSDISALVSSPPLLLNGSLELQSWCPMCSRHLPSDQGQRHLSFAGGRPSMGLPCSDGCRHCSNLVFS